MKRIAIFGTASCMGWIFLYEANEETQAMIKMHAGKYNSIESWRERNCDGTVYIFDSVDEMLTNTDKFGLIGEGYTLEKIFKIFRNDGDGREIGPEWIVHMLLSDPTSDYWSPF